MVFFVIIVNLFVAFLQTGATDTFSPPGCTTGDNVTTCESVSKTSFIEAFFDVALTGLEGAPVIISALYVIVLGVLLIAGIVLIVLGAASVPFGGG